MRWPRWQWLSEQEQNTKVPNQTSKLPNSCWLGSNQRPSDYAIPCTALRNQALEKFLWHPRIGAPARSAPGSRDRQARYGQRAPPYADALRAGGDRGQRRTRPRHYQAVDRRKLASTAPTRRTTRQFLPREGAGHEKGPALVSLHSMIERDGTFAELADLPV